MKIYKGFQAITMVFLITSLALACRHSVNSTRSSQRYVSARLGEEVTLVENQGVILEGTGLKLKILKFFNTPCPPNVECPWSGIGIEFEYAFNGQVRRGINLVKAFGYRTTVIRSDYETYAVLRITRDQEVEVPPWDVSA